MLLAGGQGSRLKALTNKVAKPAVSFGGKYRIIDFVLSNCANSGITTVGVLTQYRPYLLHSYLGTGEAWDLDERGAGVAILPPYATQKGGAWYAGTADAITQNIGYLEEQDPEYTLILSGDQLYRMNYGEMLAVHKKNNADLTVAVMPVDWSEASRFGIMNCDDEGRIVEFEEKPAQPKSNKASMGVYIFTWEKLRKYLSEDAADPASSNDFGKNIIPNMLGDGQRMFAYDFSGYWKDVGTIESLWEANMDLLQLPMPIDLYDKKWRIYGRNPAMPPHYIADGASVARSLVTEGCEVYGHVDHSVLFAGVVVKEGARVEDSVIMPGAVVERGALVRRAIIAEGAVIGAGAIVGEETGNIAVVGQQVVLPAGATVKAGEQRDA